MMGRRALFLLTAVLSTSTIATAARADDDSGSGFSWDHSFSIKSDLRFRLEDKSIGDWYGSQTLVKGIEREQNTLGAKLKMKLDKFRAVGNVELTLFGYQQKLEGIGSLSQIADVQPYRFDVNELYVEADDFILKGLDVRIGQQIVQWGVGDQFNPTNTINSDDLRDPLLFGKQAGNFMIRADYYITDDLSWSAVMVPLFRPALLPESAALGVLATDRLPMVNDNLRFRVASEQAAAQALGFPTVVGSTTINMPEPSFKNIAAMFRLAWTAAKQDFALSYYHGRTKFPVAVANHTREEKGALVACDPVQPQRCAQGLLATDLTLAFPEMHVYGFNVAGEFPRFSQKIAGIGYRFEGALIVPAEQKMILTQGALPDVAGQPAGEYDYANNGNPAGSRPDVVTDHPFLKWTLGLDYTFGEHVYVNLQWVHGLVDEYGAGDWIFPGRASRGSDVMGSYPSAIPCAFQRNGTPCATEVTRPRIGDYAVLGTDIHFLSDAALARLFMVFDMAGYDVSFYDVTKQKRVTVTHPFYTPEGFSAVVYPEFDYNFGNGFQMGAGALFLLGKNYTKFGDPASGGSLAFLRASYAL